jgi:hypothetical protein
MIMDCLPLELWDRIFKYACTDGGHTGCALASVSRCFRDVSSPLRYYSIALRGAVQIRAFIRLLDGLEGLESLESLEGLDDPKRTEPQLKVQSYDWRGKISRVTNGVVSARRRTALKLSSPVVQIRHLFLADCVAPAQTGDEWTEEEPQRNQLLASLDALVDKVNGRSSTYFRRNEQPVVGNSTRPRSGVPMASAHPTIAGLLARLAPTLEHLCYDQTLSSSALFAVDFPVLVEMTCRLGQKGIGRQGKFRRPRRLGRPGRPIGAGNDLSAQMPILERLHVVMGMGTDAQDSDAYQLVYVDALPQSLSFVRFSDTDDPSHLFSALQSADEADYGPWMSLSHEDLTILVSRTSPVSSINLNTSSEAEDLHVNTTHLPHLLASEHAQEPSSVIPSATTAHLHRDIWLPPSSGNNDQPALWKDIMHKVSVMEDPEAYDLNRLYKDWLLRVQGEDGCWKAEGTLLSSLVTK